MECMDLPFSMRITMCRSGKYTRYEAPALTVTVRRLCRYETIIATLCDSLDSLDEPEARAAMVWIIGEYAERIDNADELLESFLEVHSHAGCMMLMHTHIPSCDSLRIFQTTA